MKIAEIFYSIQGEGSLVGIPSVFVRSSGCNLRCVWCDTPYTSWNPEGANMTVPEIAAQVLSFGARHVVVTGGEPMIAPEIIALTENLKSASLHITVETAGTVYTPVRCDLMSVSPKLSNSTPLLRDGGRWAAQHDRLRHQSDVLRQLALNYRHQFKFVLAQPSDLSEVQAMVAELALSPECVILMPEGVNRDVLQSRGLWLVDICKQFGYRFSPRLHVDLWGDKRGV